MHTQLHRHTHKSDIHEIIFFEASVGGRMMEWNTLYMLLCLCKAFVFITHLPALHTFLIYQFQFLSPCHSRKAEDIFGCCHSSPREPESCLLFLFRLPKKNTPWWPPCWKQKMQVALIILSPFFLLWNFPFGLFNLISSGHRSFWILLPWKDILPFPKASK